jgi:hypothetical protein
MRYHVATGVYKKFSILSIAFVFALTSISGAALPFAFSKIAAATSAATPSTNIANKTKNWAHINEVSKTSDSVTLEFVAPRNFLSCFEYRADGNTSQQTSPTSPNAEITDGRYPSFCLNNSSRTETIPANTYVEVRMVFGGEKNERFDWTQFDTTPLPNTSGVTFVNSPKYTRANNSADIAAQIVTLDTTTETRFFIDGNTAAPISGYDIGGAGATTNWWRLTTPLPAGEHIITAEIKIGGNWYPVNGTGTAYSLDTPWAEYLLPQTNQTFRPNDKVVRIKADDEFNQFKNMVVVVNSLSHTINRSQCDDKGSYILCDLENLNLPEGTYTAKTTTYTQANNRVDNLVSTTFNIDGTAPVVANLAIENVVGNLVKSQVKAAATITDTDTESVNFYVTNPRADGACTGNGSKLAEFRQTTASVDGKYRANLDVNGLDGEYCVSAVARDHARNNSAPKHQKILIDNTAPTTPIIQTPTAEQYFSTAPIQNTWTASTDASGISKYQVEYVYDDGHTFIGGPTRDVPGSQTSRTHNPSSSEQGGVTIRVRAIDNTGNESVWSNPVHYTYDATAPTVPTNGLPHNTDIGINDFHFTWDNSTDKSPVTYEFQSSLNPAQTSNVLTAGLWKSGVLSSNTIHSTGAPDGTWYWQVRAIDAAGNKSAWSPIWNVTLDSIGPTATINLPAGGTLFGGNNNIVNITGTVTDPTNIQSYSITTSAGYDSGQIATSEGPISHDWNISGIVGEGSYTITLTVLDKAGNTHSDSRTITVDNQSPAITTNINEDQLLSGTHAVNAEIGEVGNVSLVVQDKDGNAMGTANASSTTGSLNLNLNTRLFPNGIYKATFTGEDALGNQVYEIISFRVFNSASFISAGNTGIIATLASATIPTPAGLTATQFNTNNPQVLGIATTGDNSGQSGTENSGKVKASATNKNEKEIIESASSSFAWYWILLLIAFAVAMYYAYRNWKLQKETN